MPALVLLSGIISFGLLHFTAGNLDHVSCDRKFSKLGCVLVSDSVMKDLLITDRDVSRPEYQGYLINWGQFDKSIHSLACRCYKKAEAEGYTYFGIRYFGECYGTKEDIKVAEMARSSSTNCIGPTFKQCVHSHDAECVGKKGSEYVYVVDLKKQKAAEAVNGNYSDWSDWGECSVTCGVGEKSRERVCNNPAPAGEGKDCEHLGPSTQVTQCIKKHCKPLLNLSARQSATQSSQYVSWTRPYLAIDGNTRMDWSSRSCACTKFQKQPWWQVDLIYQATVHEVVLYNRMDCCSARLSGAIVTVGDDAKNASLFQTCGQAGNMRGISVKKIVCEKPLEGRHVRVSLPGKQFLTLCEVEVMGHYTGLDLAHGKKASQSSEYHNMGPAARAVDGKSSGSWTHRSCTHTTIQNKPWWRVDLGKPAHISRVVVFNRVDCCSERLNNFIVTIIDKKGKNHICGKAGKMSRVPVKEVKCPKPLNGNIVQISLPGRNYLTLCEVKVVGEWSA